MVCCVAVDNQSIFSTWLTWTPLRHFGNMSYSYYLVRGFVVVPAARIVVKIAEHDLNVFFWAAMVPIFVLRWVAGAALFLTVENLGRFQNRWPYRLAGKAPRSQFEKRRPGTTILDYAAPKPNISAVGTLPDCADDRQPVLLPEAVDCGKTGISDCLHLRVSPADQFEQIVVEKHAARL